MPLSTKVPGFGPSTSLHSAALPRVRACPIVVTASMARSSQVDDATAASSPKVVGMGSCGLDYLAAVAAFPSPDDKLRTEQLQTQGGGNCANALTAAARLGMQPVLVTKIGDDSIGDAILAELEGDGVDTGLVLRAQGHPSPFTYIIVDLAGGTRTCIHTPGAALGPAEMTPQLVEAALAGAQLVYFDGRLTEAAAVLAGAARERGIPVLVECERLRPALEQLAAQADYVTTSAHFPQAWTGEECIGDAMVAMLAQLPRARWLLTTRGRDGSILLERCQQDSTAELQPAVLQDVLDEYGRQLPRSAAQSPGQPACTSVSGVAIRSGVTLGGERKYMFRQRRGANDSSAVREAALAAATAAASANAAKGAAGYRSSLHDRRPLGDAAPFEVTARVIVASAASLPQEAVVDTTGAGDAFVGSTLYGLCSGMAMPDIMRLAAVVAACKCTAMGARGGLPQRAQLDQSLLRAQTRVSQVLI